MILIVDSFLSSTECDQLVRWYKANAHTASLWPRNSTVKTATSFQISAPRITNKLFGKIQDRAEDGSELILTYNSDNQQLTIQTRDITGGEV